MKKQNSLIFSGLFFLAALLAEVYCFIAYREDFVILAGVLLVVLISAYLLFDSIYSTYLAGRAAKEAQAAEQYEKTLESLDKRLEEFERLQKALFVASKNQTRELGEGLRTTGDMIKEAGGLISENLKQAAMTAARYNREDLKRVAAGSKKAGDDMIKALRDSTSQITGMLPEPHSAAGGGDSRDTAVITECINRNFESVKLKIEGGFELMEGNLSEIRDHLVEFKAQSLISAPPAGSYPVKEEPETISEAKPEPESANTDTEPFLYPDIEDMELEPDIIPDITDIDMEPDVIPDIADIDMEPEPVPIDADPNKQMSPDEIAALFAANDTPPEPKPEPAPPDTDPNKQMSPDEIAALFAAADNAPPEPKPEPAPLDTDPNKQMSPDEIAALFAAADAGEKMPEVDKKEPEPEPFNAGGDANKQMSPEEIAALIASMGQ